jgi:hypothetical protein
VKGFGVVLIVVGAAIFLLPILGYHPALLYQLGSSGSMLAVVLVLIGLGLFFFSSYD